MRARLSVAFSAFLLALAACGGYETTSNNNGTPNPPTGNPVAAATIEVRNDVYVPSTALLSAGGTVTWEWIGANGHSVTSTGVPAFSPTAPISYPPKTLVVTFANAGTYAFYCTAHGVAGLYGSGQMTGAIFVQ